eukprot:scaffold102360_cov19-Tisochrysis_lutea.AAC.1
MHRCAIEAEHVSKNEWSQGTGILWTVHCALILMFEQVAIYTRHALLDADWAAGWAKHELVSLCLRLNKRVQLRLKLS